MPLKFGTNTVNKVLYGSNVVRTLKYNDETVFSDRNATDGTFHYYLLDDDTYQISPAFDENDDIDEILVIPGTYQGKTVSTIASSAFSEFGNIKTLQISSGIKVIRPNAFDNCSLTSVTLCDTLEEIQTSAFVGCNLGNIVIPKSVKTIGHSAFESCSLDSVTFEANSSLTTIGNYAFYENPFVEITIPDSVISIGDDAFEECWLMTSITLGSSLKTIGNYAFQNSALTSIHIPKSVETIGQDAFYDCSSLQTLTFESNSSLTTIGSGAFCGCDINNINTDNLLIEIPDSVTSIGQGAFCGCGDDGFFNISLPFLGSDRNTGTILGYLFTDRSSTANNTNCPAMTNFGVIIRGGIICADAFANTYVSTLVLGENVTLNEFSLRDASYIADLTIPSLSSFTIAYYYAGHTNGYQYQYRGDFYQNNITPTYDRGIKALRKVTVLNGTIAAKAFSGCNLLTHITINGSSGADSFKNCSRLTTFRSNGGYLASNALSGITTLTSVTFGEGFLGTYASAFEGCTGIEEITIPETLISLGDYTFKNCTNLSAIHCNNIKSSSHNFTTIGAGVFDGCTSLGTLALPVTLTACSSSLPQNTQVAVSYGGSIDDWCNINFGEPLFNSSAAFYIDGALVKNVTIDTDINSYAFMYLNQITTVHLGDYCTIIGASAFAFSSVTKVTGCSRLGHTGSSAFYNCTSLTSFAFKPALKAISSSAFRNCIKLDITTGLYDTSVNHLSSYCFFVDGTLFTASQVTGHTNVALPVTLRTFEGPVLSTIGTSQVTFNDGYSWAVSYYDGVQTVGGTYTPTQLTGAKGLELIGNMYSEGSAIVDEDINNSDYYAPDVVVDSEGDTIHVGVTYYHNTPGYNAASRQFDKIQVTCYYATTSALNYQQLGVRNATGYSAPTTVTFMFNNSSTYYFLKIEACLLTPTGALMGKTTIQEKNEAYEEPATPTT